MFGNAKAAGPFGKNAVSRAAQFGYICDMNRIFLPLLCAFAALFLLPACTPQTAAERAYFEEKEAERIEKSELKGKIEANSALKDKDIINIVASNAAPDQAGITEDWIKRQIGAIDGQVLFPQWKVQPRGGTKYSVQYMYTVIDEQNRLVHHGFQWEVDALIKTISPPHEMKTTQPSASAAPFVGDPKQRNRIREEEASIE